MSGLGNITASQLFNINGLSGSQRKVVDKGLQDVQAGDDKQVNNYLRFAAEKKQADPKNNSIKFGSLPEQANTQSFGQTMIMQKGEDDPVDSAEVTLNTKRVLSGDESTQKRNFIGTLFNELASKFAASSSVNHEKVSDLVEAHAIKALEQGETGKKGDVKGQDLVSQANKQRGGSLNNMKELPAYAEKPEDAGDSTVNKLKAQGLVNDDQAVAMSQAAGITNARPIDKNRFKYKQEAGGQLSLQA